MKAAGLILALTATVLVASTASAQSSDATTARLMAAEHSVLDSVKTGDVKTFSRLVKAGTWGVDENGPSLVDDFIKAFKDVKVESMTASDMKVVPIDENAAIVTYKLEQKGTFQNMPWPPVVYASTVWMRQGGTWQAIFHQESTAAKH